MQAIGGFPQTSEDYTKAWNLLNDRYANEQYIIACHMKKLVNLEPVIHPGVKDLRKLYDTVESHVQSLNVPRINYQDFSPLLIQIILERLPNAINLEISCKLGKENWNMEQLLLVIHEKISARKNFEYLKQNDSDKKELNNHFTTSSLDAQIKVRKCVFCKNDDHYCDQCKMVTDIDSSKEILSKGKYCFSCLKPGHIKKNCKGKLTCYRCHAEGSHHTTLCFSKNGTPNPITSKSNHPNKSNDTEETATCLVKNDTMWVYYEYNRISISCCKNFTRYWKSANIYFRSSVNELKLKPLRQVDMGVSEFLNTEKSNMKMNEYEIVVKSLRTDENKVIAALGVPKICTGIKKQSYRFAVEKDGILQNLQLANQGHSESTNINLLIESNTYWEFLTGETKRDNNCALVAQKSIFGYLVSGPLTKKEIV